ncbi:hypothetical protein CEXT_729611 [Caerostris extrusa]|uniref:Uncharacterized protein n=1 Tax=Caerostris extrusa TaxID=172846 RepID=A0AAV4R2Q1_CAEEX|nr:hypothetical protein CEXT_729611 [Caerostris extrusa]
MNPDINLHCAKCMFMRNPANMQNPDLKNPITKGRARFSNSLSVKLEEMQGKCVTLHFSLECHPPEGGGSRNCAAVKAVRSAISLACL